MSSFCAAVTMLHQVVRTFESVREILKCVQLNIKVTEQYFPLVFKHVQYSPLADVVKVVIQLVWVVRVVKQWLKLVLGTTYNWLWWWLPLPVVETSVNVITKCLSRVILYGMKLLRVSIFRLFVRAPKTRSGKKLLTRKIFIKYCIIVRVFYS